MSNVNLNRYIRKIREINKNRFPLNKGSDMHEMITFFQMEDDFALTGSRYFLKRMCPYSPSKTDVFDDPTDWDYFAPYSPELENRLSKLGFDYLSVSNPDNYLDVDVIKVLRLNRDGVQVDVQLVNDFNTRLKIRQALRFMDLPWESLPKSTRSKIWDAAYALVKA
jgi:hypothetical protein